MSENWFALAAGAVVLVLVAAGGAAVLADDPDAEVWSPPTPDIDEDEMATEAGTATVNGDDYDSLQAALDAAEPGDRVTVAGVFTERVTIDTPHLEVVADDGADAVPVIDGGGSETVVSVDAPNVTLQGLWLTDSGLDRSEEDAGTVLYGANATVDDVTITDSLFGVWVHDVADATIVNTTVVGPGDVPVSERGNGIHLYSADDAEVRHNDLTQVRDGIYYQWSSGVLAEENRMWDLRYGVHYMYSDDNRLVGNLAFDNDVGFALMISENITVADNVAIDNGGSSGHGILVKDVDHSTITGNDLVNNERGLYVYNAHDNAFTDNLLLENDQGIHFTAGSSGETVVNNSFIHNERAAFTTTVSDQIAWNDSSGGNYWGDARTVDLDGDGTGEVRHQPTGVVEQLVHQHPEVAVFTESPAFDAVRLAESSFPVIETPGVVDHRPLAAPPQDHWRSYFDRHPEDLL